MNPTEPRHRGSTPASRRSGADGLAVDDLTLDDLQRSLSSLGAGDRAAAPDAPDAFLTRVRRRRRARAATRAALGGAGLLALALAVVLTVQRAAPTSDPSNDGRTPPVAHHDQPQGRAQDRPDAPTAPAPQLADAAVDEILRSADHATIGVMLARFGPGAAVRPPSVSPSPAPQARATDDRDLLRIGRRIDDHRLREWLDRI